jgi:hypothetical protein
MKEPKAKLVLNTRTFEIAEMTKSWFGNIIWLVEYNDIPKGSLAGYPHLIFDDDERFKHYKIIGDV